ncbi:hypothetical protein C8Q78DRAFT_172818 [Trametes maxima]|nr:hypothetical protein C8Q78DRAFT_172818 [Trametes maxima]
MPPPSDHGDALPARVPHARRSHTDRRSPGPAAAHRSTEAAEAGPLAVIVTVELQLQLHWQTGPVDRAGPPCHLFGSPARPPTKHRAASTALGHAAPTAAAASAAPSASLTACVRAAIGAHSERPLQTPAKPAPLSLVARPESSQHRGRLRIRGARRPVGLVYEAGRRSACLRFGVRRLSWRPRQGLPFPVLGDVNRGLLAESER